MLLRTLIVHASVDPAALEPAIRRAITEVDPDIHVIRVRPYAEQVSFNFRIERLMARLTSTYGLLALLVASIGLYGVTAFTVAQRTREIGVRMALGADRSRILATVVRGPVGQTLVGLAIGVPLAFVVRRLIATQLYGVGSEDPLVFGGCAPQIFRRANGNRGSSRRRRVARLWHASACGLARARRSCGGPLSGY